jgi:eukaryotic-like serine/threonine-protein kinase
MTVDRLDEEAIFNAARRLEPAAREEYLGQACGDDASLRQRLHDLLHAHDESATFLGPQPEPFVSTIDDGGRERPGTIIAGRYKLVEPIGEGGMGAVWMAQQTEPVKRLVAVKLIKPGLDSKQVLARFETERQALALMDHPNIAKVLDAGTTDGSSPRPFFVMELVKGVHITKYCDEGHLTPRQRLELLVPVCHAIQHAHQKGIIHRDIKPSNVLVALYDDQPVPKVIDFGVAKATGASLTDQTLHTSFGAVVGTVEYMSPEQASFNQLDVDTRSDVYSLGVLLYELLTGNPPFAARELENLDVLEMLRVIREQEPTKPSAKLSTTEMLPTLAANRGTEPAKLTRLLRGELDWIVMKALEKDRGRRYETANGLAMDLQRYLADEPVLAGPPSAAYRLRKFVRRNKGPVLAVSLLLAVLTAGIVGTTLGMIEAFRGRDAAETASRAAQISEQDALTSAAAERKANIAASKRAAETQKLFDFLERNILAPPRPEGELGGMGHNVSLRDAVVAAMPSVDSDFREHPLIEAKLRSTLGLTFAYLGDERAAADQIDRARTLFTEFLGPHHRETLVCATNLANRYKALGEAAKALKLREETLELEKAHLGPDDPMTLASMSNLADSYHAFLRDAEALKLREETLARHRATLGPHHEDTLHSMHNLAFSYRLLGQYDRSLKLHAEALELQKEKLGPRHSSTLSGMFSLASRYRDVGRFSDAAKLQAETLELRRAHLGPDHPDTLLSMDELASCLADLGRDAEALKLREEIAKRRAGLKLDEHPAGIGSMELVANSYVKIGRQADAVKIQEKVLAWRQAKLGPEHRDTLANMVNLASAYCGAGRHADAIKLGEKTLALQEAKLGRDHPESSMTLNNLAVSYAALKQHQKALILREEVLELRKNKLGNDHPLTLSAMHNLANSYVEMGRHAEALKLREEVLKGRRVKLGNGHPQTLQTMHNLGMSYQDAGQYSVAAKIYEETLALRKEKLGRDDPDTLHTMHNLASCYCALGRAGDALKLHQEVLALRQAKLGPDARDTLKTAVAIAGDYGFLGKFPEAIQISEEALPRLKAKLGKDDQVTLFCMHNLGSFYTSVNRNTDAVKFLEETVALSKAKLGADHRDTLESMRDLTNNYFALNRYADALKLYDETKELQKARLNPDSGDSLRTVFRIAYCMVKVKRGVEAIPLIDDLVERSVRRGAQSQMTGAVLSLRLEHFSRVKDAVGCRATAEMWEKSDNKDGVSLYNAACARAVTAAVIHETDKSPAGAKEASAEADLAMAWLKKAVAAGFRDAAQFKRDSDLDALRDRDDFKKLLADLEASPSRGDKR